MTTKILLSFPPQPWITIDPIILDGALELWPELARDENVYYGGGESWSNTDLADKYCEECDAMVKVGTPAWWNLNDRQLYARWLETKKPYAMFGIGAGGGDEIWGGFEEDPSLMQKLMTSPALFLCVVRDANAWRICRDAGVPREKLTLLPCPGYFAVPRDEIVSDRKRKDHVCVDVLDPRTVVKDGLYDVETYYSHVAEIVNGLESRGARVTLTCQRPFGERWEALLVELRKSWSIRKTQLSDPASWTLDGESVVDHIERSVGEGRGESLVGFPTREEFRAFFSQIDCYVGSRTHGVLPAAGAGVPVAGMRIDMRGFAWETVTPIVSLPHTPPILPVNMVLDWWEKLDAESTSRALLEWRSASEKRYQAVISEAGEVIV